MSGLELIENDKKLRLDDTLYFKSMPSDINGMILLFVMESSIKITPFEEIEKICEEHFYKYNLCMNEDFWELLWTKNINYIVPDPKKFLKSLKIIQDFIGNQMPMYQHLYILIDAAKTYIKDKDKLKYLKNMYRGHLLCYNTEVCILNDYLKCQLLCQHALNNNEFWEDLDVEYKPDITWYKQKREIFNKNNIDFVYDNTGNILSIFEDLLRSDNEEIIDFVIDLGFDINKLYYNGYDYYSFFQMVIKHGNASVFNYFIQNLNQNHFNNTINSPNSIYISQDINAVNRKIPNMDLVYIRDNIKYNAKDYINNFPNKYLNPGYKKGFRNIKQYLNANY